MALGGSSNREVPDPGPAKTGRQRRLRHLRKCSRTSADPSLQDLEWFHDPRLGLRRSMVVPNIPPHPRAFGAVSIALPPQPRALKSGEHAM